MTIKPTDFALDRPERTLAAHQRTIERYTHAIETAICEFGALREAGLDLDAMPRCMLDARTALHRAWHELREMHNPSGRHG